MSMTKAAVPDSEVSCAACGGSATGGIFPARSSIDATNGRFRSCTHCGTVTVVESVDYEALYATRDSGNYAGARPGLFSSVFAALKKAYLGSVVWKFVDECDHAEKLLDYGCGSGELANALASAGCKHVVAADVQQDRPASLENAVAYVPLTDIARQGPYQTIVLRHVLEHVAMPAATLGSLASCLALTGRIVVEVPSTSSIFRSLLGSRWPGYYYPFHVCVFSNEGLHLLAARAGLTVLRIVRCNPPILGTVFVDLGLPRSVARLLAIGLYPIQWAVSVVSRRPEAIRATLVPSRTTVR